MKPKASVIKKNRFAYEELYKGLSKGHFKHPRDLVKSIEFLAQFAWRHHPGLFSDVRVERLLHEIAEDIECGRAEQAMPNTASNSTLKILHVASLVALTGGHTRFLLRWVQKDTSSKHKIVFTRQELNDVPKFFKDICAERAVELEGLSATQCPIERALVLRKIAIGYDRIILHHHPDDAIPSLAFDSPGGPPVAMFNHAHFSFVLGCAVSDCMINTNQIYADYSYSERFARNVLLAYGPANFQPLPPLSG